MSGGAGVGKSAALDKLAKLGCQVKSAGGYFRQIFRESGYSDFTEFEESTENDSSVDTQVDERSERFFRGRGKRALDGRLSWRALKRGRHTLRILLVCNDEVRFWRVASREKISFAKAKRQTLAREASIARRYKRFYKIRNWADPDHYDLIINTTYLTVNQTVEIMAGAMGLAA